MTSKHTPGKWIAKSDEGRYNNSRNTWRVDDEEAACSEAAPITLHDGTVIAFAVASDDDYYTDDRVGANARLIASSPDLLDNAIVGRDKIGPWLSAALEDDSVCEEMKASIREWLESNHAAIGKATGEL